MKIPERKRLRRERLRTAPFPPEWREIISRNLSIFPRLPTTDQAELEGHVQVFLNEKRFEGCGGLELTDEIKVTIAAQACLLLLHRETDYYPALTSILIYPSAYVVDKDSYVGGHIWKSGPEDRLGHTARRMGSLVLAWDEVKHGAADPSDGQNLVVHEFAHQLDFEDSNTDGAPALATRAEYLTWARVMQPEFDALREAEETGAPTVLDTYGAANPAEFFAVATEAFFERPRALREKNRKLYDQLAAFFRQDPISYSAEEKDPRRR
jgi:Mlc titration factor MtfA (ptsG expression regulator)